MAKRIYKYPMTGGPGDTLTLALPKGANALSGRLQYGTPVFWFEIDPYATETENWLLSVVFTGFDLPMGIEDDAAIFLGTDIDAVGLVYHFYAKPL